MKKPSAAVHKHGDRSAIQLSKETWPVFDKFFKANGGVWGGCWCVFYQIPGGFDSNAYAKNRKAKSRLVSEGKAHGTIVLCGGDPVGWCQFGPKEELPRIDNKKNYVPTSKDAWRITCLFIDRRHRGKGVARLAVDRSISAMKELGVRSVEAYPVEGRRSATLLWSGTPGLFEGLGFSKVGPLGKNSWIYSLSLGGKS